MNPAVRLSWIRLAAISAGAFTLVFALRLLLQPVLGPQFAFMFFFPVICLAAWVGGWRAGLPTAVLTTMLGWFVWLPDYWSFRLRDAASAFDLVAFFLIALGMVYVMGKGRRAFLALQQTQAREAALRADYEVTLRSIGDAVIATDEQGLVTFMNAAAEQLTGWAFAVARGASASSAFAILQQPSRAVRTSPVRQVLEQRRITNLESDTLLLRRDGTELPISHRAAPIFQEDGTIRGVVLVFRDESVQARAQQALTTANAALQQQVGDLRTLHEFSGSAVGAGGTQPMLDEVLRAALTIHGAGMGLLSLVAPDRDGLMVAASAGFTPEFVTLVRYVPSGGGACGWCYLQRRRVVIEDVRVDPRFEAYRGAAATAGFRSVHSTPLITRAGKLVGVLSVHFPQLHRPSERETQLMDLLARSAADLIDNAQLRDELKRELEMRRAAADELRIMNDRFKLAAAADSLTLFEQDRELRYVWLYPAHPEQATAIGRTDVDLVSDEEARPLMAMKRAVLQTGVPQRLVAQATLPSGMHFYDISVSPTRNQFGEINGVAGTALDVTERRQAELALGRTKNELARTNAELEERVRQRTASVTQLLADVEAFSSSISHDLRAPLRTISGLAGELKEVHAGALSEDAVDLLSRIIRGTDRMDRLIADVLAYTRVNRDELNLSSVSLDKCLRDVIQHSAALQLPAATIACPEPLPGVMGNEAFIVQVFSNLLANAVKFVRPGQPPVVTVTAQPRGNLVRVWINDNGIGISPEVQPRLFGMFERLDAGHRYEGTGIGLAIVRRALHRMGGNVGVESDGVNGSRFWFELPAVTSTAAQFMADACLVIRDARAATTLVS